MNQEKDPENKKEELIKAVDDAQKGAEESVEKGQSIVEQSQYMTDVAKATKDVIKNLPDDSCLPMPEWNRQLQAWKRAQIRIGEINRGLTDIYIGRYTTINTITTSAVTSMASQIVGSLAFNPLEHSVVQLNKVVEKAEWAQKAGEELIRLGLDAAIPGKQSALNLLQEAQQAFLKPSAPNVSPIGVLIPVREAIKTAIAELLRRRPTQESTKRKISNKVLSIGKQCLKTTVPQTELNELASEAEHLIDVLSSAKEDTMERERTRALFNRACTFLKRFLGAIDETKLKSK